MLHDFYNKLHNAILNGNTAAAVCIIERALKLPEIQKDPAQLFCPCNYHTHYNAIHFSVCHNNFDLVRILILQYNALRYVSYPKGGTVWIYCAALEQNNIELARFLLGYIPPPIPGYQVFLRGFARTPEAINFLLHEMKIDCFGDDGILVGCRDDAYSFALRRGHYKEGLHPWNYDGSRTLKGVL